MGSNYKNREKWYELLLNFKWPHNGFTLGYDIIQPDEQTLEINNSEYVTLLLYLGVVTVILNYGIKYEE